MIPLGLRSHNPGNIEFGSYARTMGSTRPGEGGRFAYFESMRDGLCALANLLIIYGDKHGIDTITGIVNRWAPGNENNVAAYIDHLCRVTELKPDDRLNTRDADTLFWLTTAIGQHENGTAAFTANVSDEDIDAGVAMALMRT